MPYFDFSEIPVSPLILGSKIRPWFRAAANDKLLFSLLAAHARCSMALQRVSVHTSNLVTHQQFAPSRDRSAASGLGHRHSMPQPIVLPFPYEVDASIGKDILIFYGRSIF